MRQWYPIPSCPHGQPFPRFPHREQQIPVSVIGSRRPIQAAWTARLIEVHLRPRSRREGMRPDAEMGYDIGSGLSMRERPWCLGRPSSCPDFFSREEAVVIGSLACRLERGMG